MDWLDYFVWKSNYQEMLMNYEDVIAEEEFRAECEREDAQLKYLEEKESV